MFFAGKKIARSRGARTHTHISMYEGRGKQKAICSKFGLSRFRRGRGGVTPALGCHLLVFTPTLRNSQVSAHIHHTDTVGLYWTHQCVCGTVLHSDCGIDRLLPSWRGSGALCLCPARPGGWARVLTLGVRDPPGPPHPSSVTQCSDCPQVVGSHAVILLHLWVCTPALRWDSAGSCRWVPAPA